jgi:hypothetical protein
LVDAFALTRDGQASTKLWENFETFSKPADFFMYHFSSQELEER